MKISILCTNKLHPVYSSLQSWCRERARQYDIELFESTKHLTGGDILFLISCNEIIGHSIRSKYKVSLVLHASDLPKGRGWSPHIWQILEGKSRVTVSLLEAADGVDTGRIWAKKEVDFEGHELYDEINSKLFAIELHLMDFAIENYGSILIAPQTEDIEPTYYRKRTPEDSRIDPNKSISEQFDLLRVADAERFPAFFDIRGHRYKIVLAKLDMKEE